jgi:regulator of protease activity HflC (stomatin/prohibitin superfamily)
MTSDDLRKLLASPEAIAAVAAEIKRQAAERTAAREAEEAAERQAQIERIRAKAAEDIAAKLAALRADIEAIKKADRERRLLDALNYAQHNNGRLTFVPERFAEYMGGTE